MDLPNLTPTEIVFQIEIPVISEAHRKAAEQRAREAFVMELLRQGAISAGRAAQSLGCDRWQLSELMGQYGISPFPEQTLEELQQEVAQAKRVLEGYKL